MTQALITPDPAGWSDRQLRGLTALFSTIAPPAYEGESERHARLAAGALSEVAEPADLRQLKLLLELLEAPIGVSSLTGTRSFSRISQAHREKLLHSWSTSRIPQRRTFFQTIKRLAGFFAYADPGLNGGNPRWGPIGYAVPSHPISDPGPVAAGIITTGESPTDLALDTDVVVVGSGAGGGVVAARLAELGHSVIVVEAGPYVAEGEMPRNELDAFTRLYLDHGMTATKDLGLAILAGAALGGGTLINWATCIEPPDWVRQEWAADWGLEGFNSKETDTDLARLRVELGFAPPPSIGPKDQAILDGAAALGWEAAPTERNAVDCGDCGACGFGCPRGAKRSGQRLHLATAAGHGARILPDAAVARVDMSVGRAAGVSGSLAAGGRFSIRARTVVVAAGALRTPLVLRRSGLTNPQIGANLHLHPTVAIAARYSKPVEMWRDTMQGARSLELIRQGVLIEWAPAHPGLIALAFPWQGAEEQASMMNEIGSYGPLIGIVRDSGAGRVSPSRSGRARIEYRISREDAATARTALAAMARLARAAGAERLVALGTPAAWHDVSDDSKGFDAYLATLAKFEFAPNRGSAFSAHQMGTARAGSNTKTSATDPWGRIRDARGLYVADTSLFPTALGVNPMVTVMALAARVARAVHADRSTA